MRLLRAISLLAAMAACAAPAFGQATGFSMNLTNNPNPSNLGQTVALTVTGNSQVTGQVIFYEVIGSGRTQIGTANWVPSTQTNSATATLPISTLSAGSHQLNASYTPVGSAGGATFTSNTVTQSVNRANSSVLVSSQPNPSTYGQAVTLSATVSPSGATGSVSFFDGTTQLGAANLVNGSASTSTTAIPAGSRTIRATYNGDNNYNSSTATTSQVVNRANTTTTLTSSPNPSAVGERVIITATISGAGAPATGSVTFFDGSTSLGTVQASGTSAISTTTLSEGNHALTAQYSGDSNYNASNAPAITQTVGRAPTQTSLSVNPTTANVGQTVTMTATVSPSAATGTVRFLDGTNQIGTGTLANGTATFATSSLTAGSHSVTANYTGDNTRAPSTSSPVTVTINQTTAVSLSVSPNPATVGQPVTLTATVTPSSTGGSVTFLDGNIPIGTGPLSGGTASFTTSSLSVGTHSLTAAFGQSTSNVVSEVINKANSATSLAASPTSAASGQAVTLSATVSPSNATGTVTFRDGTNPIGTANVSNGTAAMSTSTLATGSHSLTASYSGDNTFNASTSSAVTVAVGQAVTPTTTSLSVSPNPANAGAPVTLNAVVSPSGATGTVTFRDGTNPIGQATISGGSATLVTTFQATGNHGLTAAYAGDSTFGASSSTLVTLVINAAATATQTTLSVSPNPANVSQPVTLSAVVSPAGATGTVTFRDGTNPIGQATISAGTATLVTTFQTAGNHGITAAYAGDSTFNASSSTLVPLVVNAPANPTQTSLSVSPNPANAGTPVTLNAVVLPATATGTVTFKDGNATLGTATLINGSATFTTSSLTIGSHTLTAEYGGNSTNNASVSNQIVEVINPSTAGVVLSGLPNPATFGQPVVLTVTITPSTATGSVTIFDAFTASFLPCADCTVRNGVATLTTSTLAVGAHSLQAAYSGDANNPGRQSNIFILTITAATTPTTTTLTAPTSAAPGQPVTMVATVTGSGATGSGPTGTVAFREGTTTLGTATLNNGTASFSISTLAVGSHVVVASYSGDSRFAASTSAPVTITVATTACIPFPSGFVPFSAVNYVSSPNTAGDLLLVGSMSAANFATYRNLPLPAGPNQLFCGTVLLADGFPVVAYVPTSAERNGDFSPFAGVLLDPTNNNQPFPGGIIPANRLPGTFAARILTQLQNSTTTLSVSPATSSPGQAVTLTATVAPSSATGMVTFQEGAAILGTSTVNGGTATLTITTLAAGTHSITASYSGDSRTGPSTSSAVSATVSAPQLTPTQTVLSVAPNPSVTGQTVTLTATVAPSAATGTVTFRDGAATLGTATLTNGAATLTTTALPAGSRSLSAAYGGDATRAPSTSAVVTQTVNAATPVRITTASLPDGFVNTPYSQTLTATGGTGTLRWTLAAGAVPGLTLSAAGVLAGTPSSAGTFTLDIGVQDSVGQGDGSRLTLRVNPVPPVNITVTQPTTITDQPTPQASLPSFPLALSGTYRLTFTPNAAGLPTPFTNDAVQFITGGTSATVTMPANSTGAVALPAVQLGNVAGTITVQLATLTVAGSGAAVPLPSPAPSVAITVPRLAPVIMANSVRITNITATGFQVVLNAVSTPRDVSSASLTFTAASGTQLNGTSFPSISLTAASAAWFVAANSPNGGAFSVTMPFTYSGDTSALNTVSVTLTNSVGTSAAVSGGR